jgi:hypothetical protein
MTGIRESTGKAFFNDLKLVRSSDGAVILLRPLYLLSLFIPLGVCAILLRLYTSTALYFYGASKKTLHKPRVTFGNILLKISYSPNYNLQFLFQQFLSKTYIHF